MSALSAVTTSDLLAALERGKETGILVYGLGLSGMAAVRAFREAGYRVVAVDESRVSGDKLAACAALAVEVVEQFGREAIESVARCGATVALPSPGLSPRSELVSALRERGVRFISELDIYTALCGAPQAAVTGTNGKSTTTALLHHLLRSCGMESVLAGNIGVPFLSLLPAPLLANLTPSRAHFSAACAEVSSYQLEWSEIFTAHVGIWLNLSDNHLERHQTLEEYLRCKMLLFERQSADDLAVISGDDTLSQQVVESVRGQAVRFGSSSRVIAAANHCLLRNRELELHILDRTAALSLQNIQLVGEHNRLNIAAAVAAAVSLGAEIGKVQSALCAFAGLEHRLERIGEKNGLIFINDSKATTPNAAAVALRAVAAEWPRRQIVLLVGGKMKLGSWAEVRRELERAPHRIIAFGGSRHEVVSALGAGLNITDVVPSLEAAVVRAQSSTGSVVLLSPGCASFDAYSGFEERGRHFKRLIDGLEVLHPHE